MSDSLTPKAIVAALDEHIIGQKDAKRAVAVALRNRWRRQRLAADLRDEVTPKNILMIGPTGCGKTEISRRLAKLADAPFVKVEATKFTEVGYVGRDVEQIARDLVEEAIRLEKDRRREAVREAASQAAMDRLLNALVGENASEATREAFRQRIVENAIRGRHDHHSAQLRAMGREERWPGDSRHEPQRPQESRDRPSFAAQFDEQAALVHLGLELLDDESHDIISRRLWSKESFEQIGAALSISADACRMRFHRAVARLSGCVDKVRRGEIGQLLADEDEQEEEA